MDGWRTRLLPRRLRLVGSKQTNSDQGKHYEGRFTRLQKRALIVLVIGAIVALGLAFGPVWFVRGGVAVALLAGLWALVTSFRELRFQMLEAERRLIRQTRDHGLALSAERQRNGEVVAHLRRSNVDATKRLRDVQGKVHEGQVRIVELTGTIGRLNAEISSLRGNNVALGKEVRDRDARIAELTDELEAARAEIAELRAGIDADDVVALPRHAAPRAAQRQVWEELPTAEELWAEGNYPTVVDLQRLAFPIAEPEPRRKQA